MGSYKIRFSRSVEKDLGNLPKRDVKRVWDRIKSLQHEPHPVGAVKLRKTESAYRIRVGDYRIVYEILRHEVVVKYVRHRKDVYRRMK